MMFILFELLGNSLHFCLISMEKIVIASPACSGEDERGRNPSSRRYQRGDSTRTQSR
jgi:hypothetical protein